MLRTLLWVSVTVVLASVCHLYSQRAAVESRKALETALDSKARYDDRYEAVLKLRKPDRLRMQKVLMQRIPGEWDVETCASLSFIGIAGHKSCLPKLEWLQNEVKEGRYGMNGKFNHLLRTALQRLERRQD